MSLGVLRHLHSLFVVIILLLCLQLSIVITTTNDHVVQAWIPPTANSFMLSRSSKRQTDCYGQQQELIRINYQSHNRNNLEKTITKSMTTIQLHFQRVAITVEQQKRTKAKTTTLSATTNNITMQQKQQQPKSDKKQQSKKPSFSQAVHTARIQQRQQLNMDKKKTLEETKQKNDEEKKASLVSTSSTATTTQTREYKINSDSFIGQLHKERLATAGRPGTKRFIDPCKVYIGNLPFTCTGEQLNDYVCNIVGLSSSAIIHQCKVIYDWKTLKSKGYGFVIMTEPIYATVLMTKCDNNATLGSIDNRRLTISQGKSKEMEKQLLIEEQDWIRRQEKKNNKKKLLNDEDLIIDDAIYMDQSQIQMLKRLDPDLAIGIKVRPQELSNNLTADQSVFAVVNDTGSMNMTVISIPSTQTDQDERQIQMDDDNDDEYDIDDDDDDEYDIDDDDDDIDIDDDDDIDIDNEFLYDWEAVDKNEVYDDSDDGIDGIWDENKYDDDENIVQVNFDDDDYNKFDTNNNSTTNATNMNREQRRIATAAASKQRKLSNKGFG